jgi:hypothetical protein
MSPPLTTKGESKTSKKVAKGSNESSKEKKFYFTGIAVTDALSFQYVKDESTGKYVKGPVVSTEGPPVVATESSKEASFLEEAVTQKSESKDLKEIRPLDGNSLSFQYVKDSRTGKFVKGPLLANTTENSTKSGGDRSVIEAKRKAAQAMKAMGKVEPSPANQVSPTSKPSKENSKGAGATSANNDGASSKL